MKKLIASIAILASTATLASTTVIWVRGNSAAEVEAELMNRVQSIQGKYRARINGKECIRPKVYAASAPKKSYRANRFGDLEPIWTGTASVKCRD